MSEDKESQISPPTIEEPSADIVIKKLQDQLKVIHINRVAI